MRRLEVGEEAVDVVDVGPSDELAVAQDELHGRLRVLLRHHRFVVALGEVSGVERADAEHAQGLGGLVALLVLAESGRKEARPVKTAH